jgi:hypothetical protein
LKPLSVTLPYAARFTDAGDSEPCMQCNPSPAKAKTVTVDEGVKGKLLARFLISLLNLGALSDE